MNVHNYGNGHDGALTNPIVPLNNSATVNSAVVENGITKIQFSNMTSNGLTKFQEGRKVLFHVTKQRTNLYDKLGRFIMATISKIQGNFLWLSEDASKFLGDTNALVTSQYFCQLISIPEYTTLTISNNYTATTAYNDSTHTGGIFAVAADTLNLTNGYINVEAKGGGAAYGREGLAYIGNAQDMNKLPLGQGHGSVFILARNMTINANTRIGAAYTGNNYGGKGDNQSSRGGYRGYDSEEGYGPEGRHGGGAYGGTGGDNNVNRGGYGSSGARPLRGWYGHQGAHIMVIANVMSEFNCEMISTGGHSTESYPNLCGGAGQGGGGSDFGTGGASTGYNGGGGGGGRGDGGPGGGSSGWAFFYINQVNSANTSGIKI